MKTVAWFRFVVFFSTSLLTCLPVRAQSNQFQVGWWYPTNRQAYTAPANVGPHVRVADSNVVKTVQYFANSNSIGIVTNASNVLVTNLSESNPFYLAWSNVPAGTFTLTALATDSTGATAAAPPVTIYVTNPPPPTPAVYIASPTNGSKYLAPASLTLYARAVETSGAIAYVTFVANSNVLGIVSNQMVYTNVGTEPLYALAWTNIPAGTYSLTAIATDTNRNSTTSSVVTVTVTNPPPPPSPAVYIYSPTNNSKYTAPANLTIYARAVETGGAIASVTFLANSNILGVVTNQGTYTNISTEPLYAFVWTNVSAGPYSLVAVAADTNGRSTNSVAVSITVTNPPPPPSPIVYIYSPTNNSQFTAPATVTISARAYESNGVIASVTFLANSNVLGVVSNQPAATNANTEPSFSLTWSNVPAGTYSLTAIATDAGGKSASSAPVVISVTNPPPPPSPVVYIYSPTNNSQFTAPATVTISARAYESNGVIASVTFLANSNVLGVVSNQPGATNANTEPSFSLTWSNVPAGTYSLTAIATDAGGKSASSAPVVISVTNPPPPVPLVYIASPTNNSKFTAPASVTITAHAFESNGSIASVTFLANSNVLAVVTNSLLTPEAEAIFTFSWTNVPAETYALTAIAVDGAGNSVTSAPVNITVVAPRPVPFYVAFFYPTNGEFYVAPATIGLHALVTDSNVVSTVQYFANSISVGTVTNTSGVLLTNSTEANPFFLAWSNVPAGQYSLTAVATDSAGATATSAPVSIWVLSNAPPVITIYATDPVAVAGANGGNWYTPTNGFTNYYTGGDTATFLVRRSGATNSSVTVYYGISGTASNGVDYAEIPNNVTIPAGSNYSLVTITPLDNTNATTNRYETVVLTLQPSTNAPPVYELGSPARAGAVILEDNLVPMATPQIRNLSDGSVHVSLPASNGVNYCLECSTDLVNWQPVCTNTVVKGSAHYVDPGATNNQAVFYRVVTTPVAPSY